MISYEIAQNLHPSSGEFALGYTKQIILGCVHIYLLLVPQPFLSKLVRKETISTALPDPAYNIYPI